MGYQEGVGVEVDEGQQHTVISHVHLHALTPITLDAQQHREVYNRHYGDRSTDTMETMHSLDTSQAEILASPASSNLQHKHGLMCCTGNEEESKLFAFLGQFILAEQMVTCAPVQVLYPNLSMVTFCLAHDCTDHCDRFHRKIVNYHYGSVLFVQMCLGNCFVPALCPAFTLLYLHVSSTADSS
eukprot:887102-Rhodomonas_salina.1